MNTKSVGQIGHNERLGRTYEFTRKPEDIPVPVLREFAAEFCDRHRFQGAGLKLNLSKETVRRFVLGIGTPERSTVGQFGRLYLEHHPAGYVAEKNTPGRDREVVSQLKMVLPPGEEAAKEYVRKLIEAAEDDPERFPYPPGQLRRWLETVLSAEYSVEKKYQQETRKRRRKGESGPGP